MFLLDRWHIIQNIGIKVTEIRLSSCTSRNEPYLRSSINWLWPYHTIWSHIYGPNLALVMTSCPKTTSHYFNQLWLIIKLWHTSQSNITRSAHELGPYYVLGDYTFRSTTISPMGQRVKRVSTYICILDPFTKQKDVISPTHAMFQRHNMLCWKW